MESAFEISPAHSSAFFPVKITQCIHNPRNFLFAHRNSYSNVATIFTDFDTIELFPIIGNVEGFISNKDKLFLMGRGHFVGLGCSGHCGRLKG